MQWTGCHGEERHGGDRGCGGGCNGQGVMVRRDMEVTEVVEEDTMNCGRGGSELSIREYTAERKL